MPGPRINHWREMARFFRPFGFGRVALREPLMQGMHLPQTDVFEQEGSQRCGRNHGVPFEAFEVVPLGCQARVWAVL